jgi:phenylalanyl-tRNA synthetase beta chain
MNISLNWLTDYIDVVALKAEELAEVLTHVGLNVDGIEENDADIVLDVEVTSNRSDCLGYLGVARELGVALGKDVTPPQVPSFPAAGEVSDIAAVEVAEGELCPRYTARVIRNVKVGPSPRWLVERLEAAGLRSVNNVVDVTNFVLMEYSQPLHAFDYDKLAGHKIVVRRALGGEVMVAIDQTRCQLDENMLVIADTEKAVAIAGVMGGLDTEVGEATTNILLESAIFDPLSVRRTSRKLRLMSDSNYRFERGVDPVGVDEASRRACALIAELAGGEVVDGVIDVWAKPWQKHEVTLRASRCSKLLGVEVSAERQVEILDRLGLSPRRDGDSIVCTPPSFRPDLTREADLIEEVARHIGYDRVPVGGDVTHPVSAEGLPQRARREMQAVLTGCGYDEAMSPAFIDADEAMLFDASARPLAVDTAVRKTNNVLRPTLLPSLLRACKTNQDAGNGEVSLFELASVLQAAADSEMPDEHVELGIITSRELRDLRGAIEVLLETFSPGCEIKVEPATLDGMAEGAAALLSVDGEPAGRLGQIAPEVLDRYGLEKPVVAAALRFEVLLERSGMVRLFEELPRFPAVNRDLSVIVDDAVTWQQLAEAIEAVGQPMRVGTDYVTTYRGKPIEAGRKSVTVTLTYRSSEGTLRSEQVDEQVSQVVDALAKRLGATLRT